MRIITPSRGLLDAGTLVGEAELREFAAVPVDSAEPRFTGPLRSAAAEVAAAGPCEVVLLGSVATGKYIETLLPILGERLLFPAAFSGLGDMSRGALLLRSAARGMELQYAPVNGAAFRTKRCRRVVSG